MLKSHETVYDANIKSNRSTKLEKKTFCNQLKLNPSCLIVGKRGRIKRIRGGGGGGGLSRFPKMEDFKIIKIFR